MDWRYATLQRLTCFRVHLAETLAREKNYFLTMLFLPFSGFVQAHPFADLFGSTSWAVLKEFTTQELAQAAIDVLATSLQTKGRKHFRDALAMAIALQQEAKDSYRLQPALADPMRLVLGSTRATIDTLQRQLKALDRTIARGSRRCSSRSRGWDGCGPRAWLPRSGRSAASPMRWRWLNSRA